MSLSEQLLLMRQSLDATEKELKSLESGRKASAPRARKSLQALKQSSHQLRKQITESVKGMPTKKRTKKEAVQNPEEPVEAEPEEEKPKADSSKKKVRTKRVLKKKD
jgi:hypothetical protein